MRHTALLLPLLLACDAPCDMDATAAELADGAISCGAAGAEIAEADWACALEAFGAGTPFVLRYASTGIDSVSERAVVYDGSRVWLLSSDHYGSGPWDIDGYECVEPAVQADADAGYDVLGCGSREPEGTHYQVCGEICAECGEPDPLPFEP